MQRLGNFAIARLVSEDWLLRVHEAADAFGEPVVLREIRSEHVDSPSARATLVSHARALVAVRHPNVVTHRAVEEIDGRVVLVTERVSGESLGAHLQQFGRLAWANAVNVGTAIARGLAAVHEAPTPIFHRDLKPDTVRLDGQGQVKLVDFDLSWLLERLARTTSAGFRNMRYLSPEQIDAVGVDHRSDLYCLGLLLYEMLVGRPPFIATAPRELLMAQCTEPPPPFPDALRAELPGGLEQLVFRLLEKNKASRPQSAAEVAAMLERIAQGQSVGAPAAVAETARPTAATAEEPSGRKAAWLMAMLAVAVLAFGGGILVASKELGSSEAPTASKQQASGKNLEPQQPKARPEPAPEPQSVPVPPPLPPAPVAPVPVAPVPVAPVPVAPVPVAPPLPPAPVVPAPVAPVLPEPIEEPPKAAQLTPNERKNRWLGSKLKGHDNSVAAFREVDITRKGGGFEIFVQNQFGFRCDLDFDDAGFPAKMRNCKSGEQGWGAKQKSIKLTCQVVDENEQCRGTYTLTKGDFSDPAAFKFFRRLRDDEMPPGSG